MMYNIRARAHGDLDRAEGELTMANHDRVRDLRRQHRDHCIRVEQLKQRGLDFTDAHRDSVAEVSRIGRELAEELEN